MCACEEVFSRAHGKPLPKSASVSQWKTPGDSDDERASGATSDQDQDNDVASWTKEIEDRGLFASTCNAHCVLINGDC